MPQAATTLAGLSGSAAASAASRRTTRGLQPTCQERTAQTSPFDCDNTIRWVTHSYVCTFYKTTHRNEVKRVVRELWDDRNVHILGLCIGERKSVIGNAEDLARRCLMLPTWNSTSSALNGFSTWKCAILSSDIVIEFESAAINIHVRIESFLWMVRRPSSRGASELHCDLEKKTSRI